MKTIESEMADRTIQLLTAYFDRRDLDGVLALLDQDLVWVGACRNDISSYSQAKKILEEQFHHDMVPCHMVESRLETCALGALECMVSGWCRLCPKVEGEGDSFYLRFTAVGRKERGELKIWYLSSDRLADTGTAPSMEPVAIETIVKRLVEGNRRLEKLLLHIPAGVHECLLDEECTLTFLSESYLEMLGYTRLEMGERFENRLFRIICPEDRERVRRELWTQLREGKNAELEYRVRRGDGTICWLLDKSHLVGEEGGQPKLYCVLVDITSTRFAQEELRTSEERHRIIMDQTNEIIFEWDIREDTLFFSANWIRLFGYVPITQNVSRTIFSSENVHPEDVAALATLMENTVAGLPYSEMEFRLKNGLGDYIWCRARVTTIFGENHVPLKGVGVIVNIDAQKREKQCLLYQARRDQLTGLFNKATTQSMIEAVIHAQPEKKHVFYIIDIDNFKGVNDNLGHPFGDAVLADIASKINRQFRRSDIVGRIGGDEFAVFLTDVRSEKVILKKAEDLCNIFRRAFSGANGDYKISGSVGFARYPEHGSTYKGLLEHADIALYGAKSRGKDCFCPYDENVRQRELAQTPAILEESRRHGAFLRENISRTIFDILYESADIGHGVELILEIVGRYYDVGRVYIVENSPDETQFSNTFEWCNAGVRSHRDRLQNLPYWDSVNYLDYFQDQGVFCCTDIGLLPGNLQGYFHYRDTFSVLQCAIQKNGRFWGYVGFDDCQGQRLWTRGEIDTLSHITKILSVFLLKRHS